MNKVSVERKTNKIKKRSNHQGKVRIVTAHIKTQKINPFG